MMKDKLTESHRLQDIIPSLRGMQIDGPEAGADEA
jgi:hypothetical protein